MIITKQAQRSVRVLSQKRIMHFSSGSKVWHQIITIKIIIKLEPIGQTQDPLYFCLWESLAFLQGFSNQIKMKNWLKEICCRAIYCIFQFRTDGMISFHLLNQPRFLFQHAFPSGTALFHRYVI